jgi:cob(I)alamin adenosyltransferase
VEAYGDLDELNAALGVAIAALVDDEVRTRIASIQPDLFAIGAHLATPRPSGGRPAPKLPALPQGRATEFEGWIDQADAELPELHNFVLPGGAPGAAALHLARTICRRAERRGVALDEVEEVDVEIVVYLNRLSDLLFQFARLANHRAEVGDTLWTPRNP